MKGVKRYGRIYQDDRLKSKAMGIEKYNGSMPNFKGTASLMLKSNTLWPISEKNKGINHGNPKNNACNKLSSFIHKNSCQGEEWPAKDCISGFPALGLACKQISLDNRALVFFMPNDFIFCLYQLAFLYWQNREGGSPCLLKRGQRFQPRSASPGKAGISLLS